MTKYSMTCSCGDVMDVEAENREEAVQKMQNMMNAEMIDKHMTEKHPGQPVMSVEDVHAMIAKDLHEVTA